MAGKFSDRAVEGFFALLRAGLGAAGDSFADARNDNGSDARNDIVLSEAEWEEVLSLASQQSVSGIVYAGVSALPEEVSVPDSVTLSLMAEAGRIRRRSALVAGVLDKVMEQFEGLSPVVMKGPAVAAFYPSPELRESGDIDLFFPAGVTAPSAPDGSSHLRIDGIDIDIHSAYFDLGLKPKVAVPSPEATLLMLSAHILKHAFSSGTGLRQICDIALAYKELDYDDDMLKALWKECSIVRWNNLLSSFIRQYLGIEAPLVKEDSATDRLLGIVLEGGNFGHFAADRRKALASDAGARKADTLRRILRKAPFGLRYAPGKYLWYLLTLSKGNLRGPSLPSSS